MYEGRGFLVSMPHAALYVVQQLIAEIEALEEEVSMPHAA